MILIDTSAWIFALKKDYDPVIKDKIGRFLQENEVAINGMIMLELLAGTKTKNEYDRLKKRMDNLVYIESTKSLWDFSSEKAFTLRRNGITVPHVDLFIAASALHVNALLIHADYHFDLMAEHIGLNVESLLKDIKI